MRITRVYIDSGLIPGETVILDRETSHHLLNVLKIRNGQTLHVFDGSGGYYESDVIVEEKKRLSVNPRIFVDDNRESPLKLILVQGLAKGQKMDYIIQKSVEVGINRIVPVMTEFSNVRINPGRVENKLKHWKKIIIAACEQSGRNTLPELSPPMTLNDWLERDEISTRLMLLPGPGRTINELKCKDNDVSLICGPEGGLSDSEVDSCIKAGYQTLSLGPRTLRAETAAVAGLIVCQSHWGDMH